MRDRRHPYRDKENADRWNAETLVVVENLGNSICWEKFDLILQKKIKE